MRSCCEKFKILVLLFGIFPGPFVSADIASLKISVESGVDQIFAGLQMAKVKTVDEAIEMLDSRFFEAGHFALVFHSQSIQPSSEKFPRVVLFGKDAKTMLGFNHRLGASRNLEVLQWR